MTGGRRARQPEQPSGLRRGHACVGPEEGRGGTGNGSYEGCDRDPAHHRPHVVASRAGVVATSWRNAG